MVRTFKIIALAGMVASLATPSFADDVTTLPTELVTTATTDLNKGLAEFNPAEILTPKPIEAAAAAEPAKKAKKKHHAKRRMRRRLAKAYQLSA